MGQPFYLYFMKLSCLSAVVRRMEYHVTEYKAVRSGPAGPAIAGPNLRSIMKNGLLTPYHTISTSNNPRKRALENPVEKGENAGNLSLRVFQLYQ